MEPERGAVDVALLGLEEAGEASERVEHGLAVQTLDTFSS